MDLDLDNVNLVTSVVLKPDGDTPGLDGDTPEPDEDTTERRSFGLSSGGEEVFPSFRDSERRANRLCSWFHLWR